jgi:SAM-dependent methyltransferase
MGGPHVTLAAQDTLEHFDDVDIIVRGEGELTIVEIMDCLNNDGDLGEVLGISYRDTRGHIVHNANRPLIQDLDELPLPARHLLPMERYTRTLDTPQGYLPLTTIYTSRGCPYRCSFCSTTLVWGKRWRARSSLKIIEEIETLSRDYGVRAFWFVDDAFTVQRRRVIEFCDLILERGLDIYWTCESRVDVVDYDLLSKMQSAGCCHISYGIESGSQHILDKAVKKGITLTQAENMSRWCSELGIKQRAFFSFSYPDETMEDVKETIQFRSKITAEVKPMMPIMILPGTEIEEVAIRKGVLPKGFSWVDKKVSFATFPTSYDTVPLFLDRLTLGDLFEIGELLRLGEKDVDPGTLDCFLTFDPLNAMKNIRSYKDLVYYYQRAKALLRVFIKKVFSRISKKYRLEYEDKRAYAYFKRHKCEVLLDVGCGYGRFMKYDPSRMVGIELNKVSVAEAKYEGLAVIRATALELPFNNESFEGVHCSHLIEHFLPEDAHQLLGELGRVTKVGGILIIRAPLLWDGFYDNLTHVRPYNPRVIKRYMCYRGGQRTMSAFDFKFELVDLVWRYLPLVYPRKLNRITAPIKVFFDYLYKFHIHSWRKNGYMLILRRVS